MSWLRRDRSWVVVETSSFPGRQDLARVVEQGLTRRQARNSALEWQDASWSTRELVMRALRRGDSAVPTVVYTAERPAHDRDDRP